jgi:hypothetical protein
MISPTSRRMGYLRESIGNHCPIRQQSSLGNLESRLYDISEPFFSARFAAFVNRLKLDSSLNFNTIHCIEVTGSGVHCMLKLSKTDFGGETAARDVREKPPALLWHPDGRSF